LKSVESRRGPTPKTNTRIAPDAVTAFSPSAKASIAQRQAEEQYRSAGGLDPNEKAKIGQDAYTLSIKQTVTALSEAARQRALTANQSVDSARLESELLGKTIGQQTELRANLQARQQLEQQASQYRGVPDAQESQRAVEIEKCCGRAEARRRRAEGGVSSVFVLRQSRSVHLMTDSITHLLDGTVMATNLTKASMSATLPAVIF
jgi:hypothetical protein